MHRIALTALVALLLGACGDDDGTTPDSSVNNTNGTCGNGIVETGEQCDQGAANSDSEPGACRTSCRTAYCGDGVIDDGEACDAANLSGQTCVTRGFTKGDLGCAPTTCAFDESGCTT